MKRHRQDDSPDSPEHQTAIATAFQPDQKRKAGDICKKGTDGTGYVEGKVYERGTISGDTWEFVLTVELGSRAHVLLSGNISKCFEDLPIAVGAQIRISAKGLVLEEFLQDKPKPLHLRKRFVWRDGATIHVRSKTGQEAFFDIWDATTCSNATSNRHGMPEPEPRAASIPPKRRRTTSSPASRSSVQPAAPTNGVVQSKSDDAMHMDPSASVDVVVSTPVPSTESSNGSQNPQSLPSPPPEVPTAREPGEGAPSDELPTGQPSCPPASRNSRNLSTSRPESRQQIRTTAAAVPDDSRAPPTIQRQQNAEAGPSRPAPQVPPRPSKTVQSKARKEKRKLKQLAKSGKLLPQPRADAAGLDSDEEYWAGGDEIPDHLLVAAAEQGEMGKAWSDRGSATPVPEPPQRSPSTAQRSTIPIALVAPLAPPVPPRSPPTANRDLVSPARSRPSVSNSQRPLSSQEERIDPVESLKQGCPASCGAYTPLIDFRGAGTKHIMGVVSSGSAIAATKTGEFVVRFDLFDPTNIASSGLNVCLFEKTRKALPEPAAGDIVLLRSIAGDKFNDYMCPVGPSFKGWQWAIFPAKTAMFSLAPSESSVRHFKPETVEVQYTIRLSDWWKDISAATVSFGDDAPVSARGGRTHQLLLDVGEVGYFDCTVEILHGYSSGNNTYTVFVTDYTHNPDVAPVQATWCPPKLAEVAVQVELWDSSSMVGPTMQVGEYYYIRNMRLKRSGGGFLEGRMQEGNKIQKLDEDELESQPHLVELLKWVSSSVPSTFSDADVMNRRKKDWESNAGISGGVTQFPHQLIEEVEENRHFNCTVEVVSISSKDDYSYLYVTDYTARTDLVPVSPAIASGDLAERVVRVSLNDAQVDLGRALDAGDYIAIRNLRLRPAGSGSLLCGRLGGEQRLITKVNPRATGNKELRELLRRKEDFEAAQNNSKPGRKGASARAARQAEAVVANGRKIETSRPSRKGKERATDDCVSLADVKASEECPGVFRVRARVVDFFPDDLRECTSLRCTNCDAILPKMHRMCTKCDDVMDTQTFVEAFFELYFRLADEDGTTLEVSVADERCSILQDLEPQDVHEDIDGAFDMLVSRVRPLLGDLLNASDGEARRSSNLGDEACGPMLNLTLGSWLPEGEPDSSDSRAYIVLHHSILESDA
ncbi:hypothetical protein GSI_14070 [Ganoderma sinense ZZ0214-1]|uniref:Protection of telomeres protein 1 n=1 Tax=Ganoderma sinense ZZ0214-1 TaxID=1077348 RepID=A0A2G8RS26_9APHY|nr:hypothetical protein GSI_14070 [Ganoderma sinense ZZ0214-1]